MLHIRGDDVRKAIASILVPFTLLRSAAVSPEVLYSSVEHQVIGLKEDLFTMNHRCVHDTTILLM